jgi:hypothetical protein
LYQDGYISGKKAFDIVFRYAVAETPALELRDCILRLWMSCFSRLQACGLTDQMLIATKMSVAIQLKMQ